MPEGGCWSIGSDNRNDGIVFEGNIGEVTADDVPERKGRVEDLEKELIRGDVGKVGERSFVMIVVNGEDIFVML